MTGASNLDFESRYKRFLVVAKEWADITKKYKIYADKNAVGTEFRLAALTDDDAVVYKATELLKHWQEFADYCTELRKNRSKRITILAGMYTPIPSIYHDPKGVVKITRTDATSTSTFMREDIIKRYEKMIKKLSKIPEVASSVEVFNKELKYFSDMPEGTQFRARRSGYSDSYLDIFTPEGDSFRERFGTHGILIYSKSLKRQDIEILNEHSGINVTVYDYLEPIQCSVLDDHKLYRIEDVEREQAFLKQRSYIQRIIATRRIRYEGKYRARLALAEEKGDVDKVQEGINKRLEALDRLDKMDMALCDAKVAAGDMSMDTMEELRARYGKPIEEEYGITFPLALRSATSN
jgi:hypothetical protein